MPLQRVVEPDALPDQSFAVVDQQPDVELGPGQLRGRQRLEALAQRGARDGERVDAIGLAALAARAPRRSPSAASGPAPPARRARSETARRTPRRAGSPQAPTPARRRDRAPTAARHRTRERRPRPSSRRASRPSPPRRRRACASSCACPHRARSSPASPSSLRLKWTAGGHGLLGAGPRSFQVTPDIPDRRRATQQKEVRPDRADSLKESQLAAGRDHPQRVGHHRRPESQQQASKRRGDARAVG